MVDMQWHSDLLKMPGLIEFLSTLPKSLIPGPGYVRPETIVALLGPTFDNRGPIVEELFEKSIENLKLMAGVNDDYEVLLLPSASGTDGLEATVRSLIAPDERVLAVSVGPFGDLYFNVAIENGRKAERLRFDSGKTIDMNMLENKLRTDRPSVVLVTHNETATGVINDIEQVGKLTHMYGARLFADGVSIYGGKRIKGHIQAYAGATQKAVGMSAGLSPVIVHKEELNRAVNIKDRGRAHDLVQHSKVNAQNQPLKSPPVPVVWQLYSQTNYIAHEEGMTAREARHELLRQTTLDWIRTLPKGFELFPQSSEFASPTVTCVRVPDNLDRVALENAMRAEGYLIGRGYRGLPPTIRIAHMGDITPQMLSAFLPILEKHLVALTKA